MGRMKDGVMTPPARFTRCKLWAFILFVLLVGGMRGAQGMTIEEEKNMGRKVFLEIEKSTEIVKDLPLQDFVDRIGRSLLTQAGSTPFDFNFYIVKAQDPNAYAIPGGYIFLTTGLIVLADNEQEIAGVVGHEIAHATERHISDLVDQSKRLNLATLAAVLAGALLGRGKGAEAVATTAAAGAAALTLKYTREHETEADQVGFHTLVKAGYDPQGLLTFLNKMYKSSLAVAPKIPPYLSTHPAIENRITLLESLIQIEKTPAGPPRRVGDYRWIQARAFVEEREPNVAAQHFESMVRTNPEDAVGYVGLGLAYRKMGRLDRSIEALERASALSPQERDPLRELAISQFLSGRVDQAIQIMEKVALSSGQETGQEKDVLSVYYLGRGYKEKGELSKALSLFLRVQREKPDFDEVYQQLGSVYGRMGQKGLSHFHFGKYFKLRGDERSALLHFRTALDSLERGSPEREEAQREIKALTAPPP
jgi:beta-barrel assembly-enhancing protease